MLDDAVAIGCVCEFEPQNLRVFLGLLKSVACGPIGCLRLHDGNRKIAAIAK